MTFLYTLDYYICFISLLIIVLNLILYIFFIGKLPFKILPFCLEMMND